MNVIVIAFILQDNFSRIVSVCNSIFFIITDRIGYVFVYTKYVEFFLPAVISIIEMCLSRDATLPIYLENILKILDFE